MSKTYLSYKPNSAEVKRNKELFAANVKAFESGPGIISRANSTLPHEAWIQYDTAVLRAARSRLVIYNDLVAMGLVEPISFGTTIARYQKTTEFVEARVSMDGDTDGDFDRVTYDESGVPIPFIHSDWYIGARQLVASQNSEIGEPLDVTSSERAGRVVAEKIEQMIFNGNSVRADGNTIPGLTTLAERATVTFTNKWNANNVTAEHILEGFKALLDEAYSQDNYGPFNLYVAKDIWAEIQSDYSTQKGDRTLKERIEAYEEVNRVRPGDSLPNGNVILLNMSRESIVVKQSAGIVNTQYANTRPHKHMFMLRGLLWHHRLK